MNTVTDLMAKVDYIKQTLLLLHEAALNIQQTITA